jgi:hypothetical protein
MEYDGISAEGTLPPRVCQVDGRKVTASGGPRTLCGRYASHLPSSAIAALFRTQGALPNLGPNWNTAPTQAGFVVRRHPESGERRLDTLCWGLVTVRATSRRDWSAAHK